MTILEGNSSEGLSYKPTRMGTVMEEFLLRMHLMDMKLFNGSKTYDFPRFILDYQNDAMEKIQTVLQIAQNTWTGPLNLEQV